MPSSRPVLHGRDHKGRHATGHQTAADPAVLNIDSTENVGDDQGVHSYGVTAGHALLADGANGTVYGAVASTEIERTQVRAQIHETFDASGIPPLNLPVAAYAFNFGTSITYASNQLGVTHSGNTLNVTAAGPGLYIISILVAAFFPQQIDERTIGVINWHGGDWTQHVSHTNRHHFVPEGALNTSADPYWFASVVYFASKTSGAGSLRVTPVFYEDDYAGTRDVLTLVNDLSLDVTILKLTDS